MLGTLNRQNVIAFLFIAMGVGCIADICSSDTPGSCPTDVTGLLQAKVKVEDLGLQSVSDFTWGNMQKQIELLQMQNTQDEDAIKIEILTSLKPCATCAAPKRYGAPHDGGYAMCSEFMENGKMKAGYSVGINGVDEWGADVSKKLHVPIYQFDCTNPRRPQCKGCDFHFYDLCVAADATPANGKTSDKYKTMRELMQLNGHGTRGNMSDLLLQIDVEGYEWELFANPETADSMLEFSQISIEFHNILRDPKERKRRLWNMKIPFETRLKALQNLNKHFVVTHLHGNNDMGNSKVGDYHIPIILEVLYVRRDLIPTQQCETHPQKWKQDAFNMAYHADLDTPHLP